MKVKLYQAFTAISIFVVLVSIFVNRVQVTSWYRPDIWAQMSISVGASILTLVSVITSIVIGGENDRRAGISERLTAILRRIDEKKRINPDRRVREIYDESQEKIRKAIDERSPLRYVESVMGIFSFFLLLISSMLAIVTVDSIWILGSFFVGIFLLIGYVLYVIEEFVKINKFSSPKEGTGTLSLNTIQINGTPQHFDPPENKELRLVFNQNVERVDVNVRFEGNIRSGFLHATVKFTNGQVSYIPDSNTYLAKFGFINNRQLALVGRRRFDTGILQTEGTLDLDFGIILRSERGDPLENPIIGMGFVERLGQIRIFKHCSITDDFIVDSIELRMYEDPFFKPNYKRREIDCITLQIRRE